MKRSYDTVVVGAGLAGACAALHLSRHEQVLLLEADRPGAGATGAATGMVNPLMGRRVRAVWRMDEALDALHETLELAGAADCFLAGGVLRPARDVQQAVGFREAATAHPAHAAWWCKEAVQERYPAVEAPHGALYIRPGGAVDMDRMVTALLEAAQRNGAEVQMGTRVLGWIEGDDEVWVRIQQDGIERLSVWRLVLAVGQGYVHHPELAHLPLKRIKGQTVRVALPETQGKLPFLAGGSNLAPLSAREALVGSSFEHFFTDLRPTEAQTQRILRKAARLVPVLHEADVVAVRAGARVKVPNSRYPVLDRLPGREHVWMFTGLGSKGLLTAPLLTRRLMAYLREPGTLPPEVRLTRHQRP